MTCENITIVDNITPEDEEFFSVSLNSSDPAVNLRPRMITITVLDDDGNICSWLTLLGYPSASQMMFTRLEEQNIQFLGILVVMTLHI